MVRLKPLTAWTQFPRSHIFSNDWEINSKSALHLKDDIPIIVDLVLIELFSDTKANDFPSEADSIDGRSSGKTFLLFCPFFVQFQKPIPFLDVASRDQSFVQSRQIINLNAGLCNFWGPNYSHLRR